VLLGDALDGVETLPLLKKILGDLGLAGTFGFDGELDLTVEAGR